MKLRIEKNNPSYISPYSKMQLNTLKSPCKNDSM